MHKKRVKTERRNEGTKRHVVNVYKDRKGLKGFSRSVDSKVKRSAKIFLRLRKYCKLKIH